MEIISRWKRWHVLRWSRDWGRRCVTLRGEMDEAIGSNHVITVNSRESCYRLILHQTMFIQTSQWVQIQDYLNGSPCSNADVPSPLSYMRVLDSGSCMKSRNIMSCPLEYITHHALVSFLQSELQWPWELTTLELMKNTSQNTSKLWKHNQFINFSIWWQVCSI